MAEFEQLQQSAESSMTELQLAKRVQDMVLEASNEGQEDPPPKPFICRVDGCASFLMAEIPTVDLTLLSSTTTEVQGLESLSSALCSWGCFQATGHGAPRALLGKLREAAREFFEMGMEEKGKYSKGVRDMEGYGGDPLPAEGQPLDWQDRLFLDVYPHDTRKLRFWPQNPPSFRQVLEEYTDKMKELTEVVSKGMARCLGLEENCFSNQFGEGATLQARFNYYPPSPRPDLVLGLKAHSDGCGYTIVLQDEVASLQVQKNDQWYTVPTADPTALLVLMGDQMEIMSNGVFKSPVHRVLSNAEKARISIAVFYTPEMGREIGPESGLIDGEKRPALYKKMVDYGVAHWDLYQQGKRAIQIALI